RSRAKTRVPEQAKREARPLQICYTERVKYFSLRKARKEAMSQRKQQTSRASLVQVSDPATQDWQQVVQQRLPSDLESQAKALGAFVRVRRIGSASLLL